MTHTSDAPPPSIGVPPSGPAERDYYSITEAAVVLGVSRVSIWRWIRAGKLPVWRLGHRTSRIKRQDLERLLARTGAEDIAERGHVARSDWREASASEHFVQFYEADAFLVDAVAAFIGTGLRTGGRGIVVATEAHRASIEQRFRAEGLDLAAAAADGRYVALDAAETLARFMVDGAPEPGRFAEVVGGIVRQATEGGRRVRVFGEMVALLAIEGSHAAAIRLEELWNDLQRTRSFSLFCAYPMEALCGEAFGELVDDVCGEHSRVIPAESYAALPTPDDRLRAITVLQQKALSLEAEMAARKQAQERLQAALASERTAREAAEAALRMRDDFISIASHELRTPLTALSAQAQLLLRRQQREGQLEPERVAQALQTITGQAHKLSRLLSQLLDGSRLEGGKLTLERQPTDLTVLVEQVVAGARALSDRHPIVLEAPASLEAEVDSLRLEQVLTNLLDNAIKYSPEGGPIEVVLSRPRPGAAELSVRDRGLGIPPEKRGRIFERFYQAHGNGYGSGIGLGLYISRQIVELHGGEIRAEFPPDSGTRFIVRLPTGLDEPDADGLRAQAVGGMIGSSR